MRFFSLREIAGTGRDRIADADVRARAAHAQAAPGTPLTAPPRSRPRSARFR